MRSILPAVLALVAGCSGSGLDVGAEEADLSACRPLPQRLPIPPILEPMSKTEAAIEYKLVAQSGSHAFDNCRTDDTLGYSGGYLGPTLRARRGEHLVVHLANGMDKPTNLHWHGLKVPEGVDVSRVLGPGEKTTVEFTPDQPASTFYYHPHTHMDTGRQVYEGLAGFFLLDDDESSALPLPKTYGVDDVPLVVQDKRFDDSGKLRFRDQKGDEEGMLGNVLVVNGVSNAFLDVPAGLVRLRLLNASNARTYDFAFDDGRSFVQIASDGGLLAAPVPLTRLTLAPAERAEIVVDLASSAHVVKLTSAPFDVLELHVGGAATSTRVPAKLVDVPAADPSVAVNVDHPRLFALEDTGDMVINGKKFDMGRIDEHVRFGDTEVWEIENRATDVMHPFHVHAVEFRIVSRSSGPVAENERGWKDVVRVYPGEKVRVLIKFDDAPGSYMYHCHNLEHEDMGMMGLFAIDPR